MSTHQNIWNAQHLTGSMYYGEVITFFHATSNTKPKPQFAVVSVLMPPSEDRTDVITEHKRVDLRTERTDDIQPITTSLLGAMQTNMCRYVITIKHIFSRGDAEGNNIAASTYQRRQRGPFMQPNIHLYTVQHVISITPLPGTIPRPIRRNKIPFIFLPIPVVHIGIYKYLIKTYRALLSDCVTCYEQ